MKVTRLCPAKVNLFLEVTGNRPNGYHELSTLFAKIDWADTLCVDAIPAPCSRITLQVVGPLASKVPPTPSNLVWKAAQAFLDATGLTANIRLTLHKHIPTGAGLGGGSSDAAGVLLALCKIFNQNPRKMLPVATRLGADVPLFMYPDTFLKGEGIGEKLTPVACGKTLPYLVLVYPNTAVSTPSVFSRMKLPTPTEILTSQNKFDKLLDVVRNGKPMENWKPLLFNRLEEFVLPFVPAVKEAHAALASANEGICMMSGSGSTVFTLVGTKQHAQELAARLQHSGALVFPAAFYEETHYANHGDKDSSNE